MYQFIISTLIVIGLVAYGGVSPSKAIDGLHGDQEFASLTLRGETDGSPNGTNQILAATCFKTGEQKSGRNKVCYYSCLGSEVAITIKSHEFCPRTINR